MATPARGIISPGRLRFAERVSELPYRHSEGHLVAALASILSDASARHSPISIPADARAMLVDLTCDFAGIGGAVYELGHTVAELLPTLHAKLAADVQVFSADESEDRLRSARASVSADTRRMSFIRADFRHGIVMRDASVVIMVGTLGQVHPLQHSQLLADVYRGLRPGGCVLILEVDRSRDSLLNNLFAVRMQERERRGSWSAGKAIESATTVDEKYALLESAAFRSVEVFYKHYGLCGLIAIK